MPLTDLFLRKVKHSGKPSGDKYSDGRALYLRVRESNKYWRMNYRIDGKHKTLALGFYSEVSLADARERCADARKLIRAGRDPKPPKEAPLDPQQEAEPNTDRADGRLAGFTNQQVQLSGGDIHLRCSIRRKVGAPLPQDWRLKD